MMTWIKNAVNKKIIFFFMKTDTYIFVMIESIGGEDGFCRESISGSCYGDMTCVSTTCKCGSGQYFDGVDFQCGM